MDKPCWIKRLWNGDFSLTVSFWLFGILLSPISVVLDITPNRLLVSLLYFIWERVFVISGLSRGLDLIATALIALLITLVYQAIWLIGTWRSSVKYTGNKLWKYSARVWLAFELIMLCTGLFTLAKILAMF